jgi:hypothetical protein
MSRWTHVPWKRNLLKIPEILRRRVDELGDADIVVATVKRIPSTAIIAGVYGHLGIDDSGVISMPERQVPDPALGRYSRANVEGRTIVHRDRPKVTKTFCWDTPNFGDPGRGYHQVCQDRQVYQRDFVPPERIPIVLDQLEREAASDGAIYAIRFTIPVVLNRTQSEFEGDLLAALNLLQENVGQVGIFASDATRDEYLRTIYLTWEFLPEGRREEAIEHVLSGVKGITPELRARLLERYDFLMSMRPDPPALLLGTGGFTRYFGARFSDRLVVFENVEYGNALYIMFDDWERLSKMTRLQLRTGEIEGFERIEHRGEWTRRLERIIRERR